MASEKRNRKLSIATAIFILFAGVFLGGYLVLKSGRGSAGKLDDILNGKSIIAGVCQPDASNAQKDSDDDSLKDWEEIQIHKTDPCKPDSDGDGYLDGEEIASGYDPTKKAPGDELPGTNPKTPRPLPQNLTEALRQRLADQIKNNEIRPFNEKGELLSQEQIAAYPGLQNSISEIISNGSRYFAPEEINESQIKISSDNSRESIKKYAAAAFAAFPESPRTNYESESELFLNAIYSNDLSTLEEYRKAYEKAYDNLKELAVPSEIFSLHTRQMEIISSLIKIYDGIKSINSDPLKANLAIQASEKISSDIKNWLSDLSLFIDQH